MRSLEAGGPSRPDKLLVPGLRFPHDLQTIKAVTLTFLHCQNVVARQLAMINLVDDFNFKDRSLI